MKRGIYTVIALAALIASSVQAADVNFTGTDLAAAITAANAGDRILVNTNGPLVIEDVVIAKNLTIEAGTGFAPVIQVAVDTDADTASGLEVDGATVSLIGLTFTDLGNTTNVTILDVDNSGSVLNLTRVTVTNARQHGLRVKNGATANVQSSSITNPGSSVGDAVRVDSAGTLTINNSKIEGGVRNVQFDTVDPTNLVINANFTNSRFLNSQEEGILMDDNSALGTSTGNVLVIDQCDIIGSGQLADSDGILIDDGDVEFTTLAITNNHINPGGAGGAGIKLDNKWAELNSSTTLINNNLLWYNGINEQSGIQVENFSGNVVITNNTIFNFGEGPIVIDRPNAAAGGTLTLTGNLLIEWDQTLFSVPGVNVGHGICDEFGAGAGITSNNNVLIDTSNTNFAVGVTLGGGDVTGTNALAHVASTNPANANFLQRLGSAGSTLSGTSNVSDWMQY